MSNVGLMSRRKKQNFRESRFGKPELRDMPVSDRQHNARVSGKPSGGFDASQASQSLQLHARVGRTSVTSAQIKA